jgi:hypothetical protein
MIDEIVLIRARAKSARPESIFYSPDQFVGLCFVASFRISQNVPYHSQI